MATSIPAWFDAEFYMNSKLKQLQATDSSVTYTQMIDNFTEAGFIGEEGYYQHFEQFGSKVGENLSPNALFDANQYMQFKAIQYFTSEAGGSLPEATVRGSMQFYTHEIKQEFDKAGISAWEHYMQFGKDEKLNTSNSFDESAYIDAKVAALAAAGTTATADEVRKAISDAGMTPLTHYLTNKGQGDGEVAATAAFEVPANEKAPGDGTTTGQTYALTTLVGDQITGTDGNDTIIGAAGTNAAAGDTYQAGDVIDGGKGIDTLAITVTGNVAAGPATISNVEIVKLNVTASNAAAGLLTAANYGASIEELWQVTNDAAKWVSAVGQDGVALGFGTDNKQVIPATATVDFGTSKAGTVVLDGVGSGSNIVIDDTAAANNANLATLNITGTVAAGAGGAGELIVDLTSTNSGGAVKTLNLGLDSAAKITFAADANIPDLVTIDGGASQGGLEIDLSARTTASIKAMNGGEGGDQFSLLLGKTTVATGTEINTGAGADTVKLTGIDNAQTGTATIKLGDGADKIALGGAIANYNNLAAGDIASDDALAMKMTKVEATDWSDNTLDLSGLAGSKKVSLTAQTNINDAASLTAAINIAKTEAGAAATAFTWHGDGYVILTQAAGAFAAGDSIVELVGLSDLSTLDAVLV